MGGDVAGAARGPEHSVSKCCTHFAEPAAHVDLAPGPPPPLSQQGRSWEAAGAERTSTRGPQGETKLETWSQTYAPTVHLGTCVQMYVSFHSAVNAIGRDHRPGAPPPGNGERKVQANLKRLGSDGE